MKFTTKVIAAFAALTSSANAHMIMRTPQPFNSPDSSPINADGSNFPCKIAGGSGDVSSGPVNVMTVGQMNTLSFTGGATHGGGSCQVSMAKGTKVNANTKWMVVYSIEGNCPIEGSTNLSGDPSDTGSNKFQFAIPDHTDLPSGDYTLAWTWNNKIGNREFYMNCAYVQLQGSKKKRYEPSQIVKKDSTPLPDMLVANIPQGNGCHIPETYDLLYPQPGDSSRVIKYAGGNFMLPEGNCGAVANNANSGGSSGSSSAAAAGSSAAATTAAVQATVKSTMTNTVVPLSPSATGKLSASPGVFATVSGSGVAPQAATSPAAQQTTFATSAASAPATKASSPAAPAGTGTSTGTSTGGGSTSVGAQSGPCSNEGAWSCATDGKSFQRCASGSWSASMQMAAGMTCVPGVSSNLSYNTSGSRTKRDARPHNIHRRHQNHVIALS